MKISSFLRFFFPKSDPFFRVFPIIWPENPFFRPEISSNDGIFRFFVVAMTMCRSVFRCPVKKVAEKKSAYYDVVVVVVVVRPSVLQPRMFSSSWLWRHYFASNFRRFSLEPNRKGARLFVTSQRQTDELGALTSRISCHLVLVRLSQTARIKKLTRRRVGNPRLRKQLKLFFSRWILT